MIINDGTNILVGGAFLKCFSILCIFVSSHFGFEGETLVLIEPVPVNGYFF